MTSVLSELIMLKHLPHPPHLPTTSHHPPSRICQAGQSCSAGHTSTARTARVAWRCAAQAGSGLAHRPWRSWRGQESGACSTQQSSTHHGLRHSFQDLPSQAKSKREIEPSPSKPIHYSFDFSPMQRHAKSCKDHSRRSRNHAKSCRIWVACAANSKSIESLRPS